MANTSKPYNTNAAFKANKEEDDYSSTGYGSMAESDIVVSFYSNPKRENVFPDARETYVDMQQQETQTQRQSSSISWVEEILAGINSDSAVFAEESNSTSAMRYTNALDNTLVKGESDKKQRLGMTPADTSPNLCQNSGEHIYEELKTVKKETDSPMINKLDDSSELASESIQPDTFLAQRQRQSNANIYNTSDEDENVYVTTSNPQAQHRSQEGGGISQPYIQHEKRDADKKYCDIQIVTKKTICCIIM